MPLEKKYILYNKIKKISPGLVWPRLAVLVRGDWLKWAKKVKSWRRRARHIFFLLFWSKPKSYSDLVGEAQEGKNVGHVIEFKLTNRRPPPVIFICPPQPMGAKVTSHLAQKKGAPALPFITDSSGWNKNMMKYARDESSQLFRHFPRNSAPKKQRPKFTPQKNRDQTGSFLGEL